MNYSTENHYYWLDKPLAESATLIANHSAKGFHPISISMFGAENARRMAVVLVKRNAQIKTKTVFGKNLVELTHAIDDMRKEGLTPYLVTACGAPDAPSYCMAFRPQPFDLAISYNQTKDQYYQLNMEQHAIGRKLTSVDVFGNTKDVRYCAVWLPDPAATAWNTEAMDDVESVMDQRMATMRDSHARPALIARTPSGGNCVMFVDSRLSVADFDPAPPFTRTRRAAAWDYQLNKPVIAFAIAAKQMLDRGLYPSAVSAESLGRAGVRVSAIFATGDAIKTKAFKARGKSVPVPGIDEAMRQYMESHGLRGAALAIVRGTKLAYAMGYTYAEDDYPAVQETTLYRQASVSKVFTASAIWRLLEQKKITLDTSMQSILKLTQPDGKTPATVSAKFGSLDQVTIRHLLESRSGIDQGTIYWQQYASDMAGGTLPTNGWEIARLVAVTGLVGKPGDPFGTVYGNTDYHLLGLLAATIVRGGVTGTVDGSDGVYEAIKKLVLDPLGMKMTKLSRSLKADQDPESALHIRRNFIPSDPQYPGSLAVEPLNMAPSIRSPSHPIVAEPYGAYDYEADTGCGGLSASVVDIARLAAMFSCRGNNPVLGPDQLDEMLVSSTEAMRKGKNWVVRADKTEGWDNVHGCFNGFDGTYWVKIPEKWVSISKGGSLPTVGSVMTGWTNEHIWIAAASGDSKPSGGLEWIGPVIAAAAGDPWGDIDLFPEYGMAPLIGPLPAGAATPELSDAAIQTRINASLPTPPNSQPDTKAPVVKLPKGDLKAANLLRLVELSMEKQRMQVVPNKVVRGR